MIETHVDRNFAALYAQLMTFNLVAQAKSPITQATTPAAVRKLLAQGRPYLPTSFRNGYDQPLDAHLDTVFARLTTASQGLDAATLETLAGAVYQQGDKTLHRPLHRFLAVVSNMYRSFLDDRKRANLQIPMKEVLPPLAMFQSDPRMGPFTITCETVAELTGGTLGVVSLPHTFADHPLLYGSLAHECAGHDVIHADEALMPQLQAQVYGLFQSGYPEWMGLLWDYWMDETAADIYGVLNMGPSFGYNLALMLAAFIAQASGGNAKAPRLRTQSLPDARGMLDPHPTDILRLSAVAGAVETLVALSGSTRSAYVQRLSRLSEALGGGAETVDLAGFARTRNGLSQNFQDSAPIAVMREAARQVGAMIATARLAALDGRSIQDVETWDDADENAAMSIAGRLEAGASVVGLGDDAQIIAGVTLACVRQPDRYAAISAEANKALDDSFDTDPFWARGPRDQMVVPSGQRPHRPEAEVDPYAARIIDFNPLDEDAEDAFLTGLAGLTKHAIAPVPWPAGKAPKIDPGFVFQSTDAELPKADFVIFTWTDAEANAMAALFTPGVWASPGSGSVAPSWHKYTNQWDAKFAGRSFGKAPAAHNPYIGKYMPVLIDGRRVLLFKSNFHLARDDMSMPVKDMFKQVLQQTGAKLAITSGTAGAVGARLELGDVVVANQARFHCGLHFKSAPFNGKSYSSAFTPPTGGWLKTVNATLVQPNAAQLNSASIPPSMPPRVFTAGQQAAVGEPICIITTDEFEYDDSANKFGLQGLGAMVEMDDAVLGLAVEELASGQQWLAIRNASDPQMPAAATKGTSSDIYLKYGYWTSLPSALAAWAAVLDFPV
jgi:hypothetical protein